MRTLSLLFAVGLACGQGGAGSVDGIWEGTLDVGAVKLRLVLHLKDGKGTIDSVDQGAMGNPVQSYSLNGQAVEIAIPMFHASYAGTLSGAGNEIQGTFTQGRGFPLTLRRVEKAGDTSRPQDPKAPYPYKVEEVVVSNGKAGVKLAGTLTLPMGVGPFPAVVMITGSGPQNRDEELMGHRPFLVIADRLTRNGIAVLRVDDRGVGKSTGTFNTATTEDFAGDTRALVEFLKARGDIEHGRIGLIGHSEGGVIAPMVAAETSDVAFLVMMAGTAVPGKEVILEQQMLIGRAMGVPEAALLQGRQVNERVFAIVMGDFDAAEMNRRLDALIDEQLAQVPEAQRGEARKTAEAQIKAAATPWFRYFLRYDPAVALTKVKCPVLALDGELDLQVSASQNLPVIAKALEAGGNKDYEIVKLPKLNHLFQTAKTGAPAEYSTISETVAPVALDVITTWILRHAR